MEHIWEAQAYGMNTLWMGQQSVTEHHAYTHIYTLNNLNKKHH